MPNTFLEPPTSNDQAVQPIATTTQQQIQLPADDVTVMEAFTALVAKLDPETESKQVLSQIQRLATMLNRSLTQAVSIHEINSAERKVARLRFAKGLEDSINQADEKLRVARRNLAQYQIEEERSKSRRTEAFDLSQEDPVEKVLGDAILHVGAARDAITPDHPSCVYDAGFRFIRDD